MMLIFVGFRLRDKIVEGILFGLGEETKPKLSSVKPETVD